MTKKPVKHEPLNAAEHKPALTKISRHWLINILIGILIELAMLAGHHYHFPSQLEAAQNWALDGMIAGLSKTDSKDRNISILASKTVAKDIRLPLMALIDVDDSTWRNPEWGNGEPDHAPRDRLYELIQYSLEKGAAQVILDITIERNVNDSEDIEFAGKIEALFIRPEYNARRLILARTIRHSLYDNAGEIRSTAMDAVVAGSGGVFNLPPPTFVTRRIESCATGNYGMWYVSVAQRIPALAGWSYRQFNCWWRHSFLK